MEQAVNLQTLIFFGLAIFVAWRLWSVLGTKTGQERPPVDPTARRDAQGTGGKPNGAETILMPGDESVKGTRTADRWKGIAEPGSAVANGLDAIARIEPNFDAKEFKEGAKAAYEMIVNAFAAGDRDALKPLLSKEVFTGFDSVIAERDRKGERVENTFVSIDKADIAAVDVQGRTAQVTLNFVSELISVTRDRNGVVVDGHPGDVAEVSDRWTFSRSLGSNDPNWILVETEAG